MSGVELIAAERKRQIEEFGWTESHDDCHGDGELADAAACYALDEEWRRKQLDSSDESIFGFLWPWNNYRGTEANPAWWNPGDRIRELTKAGALIAAEIDRLQRKQDASNV
jgi:hypothetical protein